VAVRVSDIERTEHGDDVEWSALVTFSDHQRVVRFGGPSELVGDADASPFLAATLLPAMAWQQDLHIDATVSPLLLARIDRLARMYALMDPTLRPPTVTVAATAVRPPASRAVAALFSRGVDSTYTAAVDRTEPGVLDELIYCSTLEPAHGTAVQDEELVLARQVAERIGLPLRAVWTDLRSFTDPMLGWSTMHGSGLGALALLVGQAYRHVVVATAYDIASLVPCGSMPMTDVLWSTEAMSLYHDDLDRSRQDKIDWLVQHRPDLLALLKVCYAQDRPDNCGTCHKCLLTMSGLRAAGGLQAASSFPRELDLAALRSQRVAGVGLRHLWVDITLRARANGDVELAEAVGDMLHHSAVPTLGELLRPRAKRTFDPDRATTFERFDRFQTNRELALLRRGEVLEPGQEPDQGRLRWATLGGSLAASLAHRRAQRPRLRPPS
jgi:hypothetical protein